MKVAIAWYGAEGQASYEYYVKLGHDVTIVTPQVSPDFPLPPSAKSLVGPDAFDHLSGFDIVVRSAGVAPSRLKTDGKIWSATNEFFARCSAPIIGVTGTKGKGTTSSLIASILQAAGCSVHLVGNIGVPPLALLDTITTHDIVVFELSSFQLWDIERSPHIAVALMIEPDHLNVHKDMDDYVAAKANIVRYQQPADITIWNPHNVITDSFAARTKAQPVPYMTPAGAYPQDGYFWLRDQRLCPLTALQLPGAHNIENACAAITAASYYVGGNLAQAVQDGLAAFTGLPHRLKFVASKRGVKYYDDSIATTPGSAIAALHSFDGPKVIILGGESKGASYDNVIAAAKQTGAKIIAVGQVGRAITSAAQAASVPVEYVDGLMEQVVAAAAGTASGEGVVLLSPAATSFDQYKNYADRGNQFAAAVQAL